MDVKVEHKAPYGGFGSSLPRETMKFSKFIDTIESENGGDLYLTTQYRDEDEVDDLDDGIFVQMLHEYCPPPLPPMLKNFPHRPALLGNLIPQQVNIWIGNSKDGTSSGLHHDFHDNLYLLLQGEKIFTIFSPIDANNLYTQGKIKKVHRNGLINYANRESTRSDGASEFDIAQHQVDRLEAMLENLEEAAITGPEREALERELEAAREKMMQLDDDDNDDFDKLFDDMDGSDFDDDFSDDFSEEDEPKNAKGKTNGKDAKATKAKDNGKTSASKSKKAVSMSEEDEEDDEELEEKEEPNSFSKITVSELHHPTAETHKKYPLLKKAKSCTAHLIAGEMLYLPAGWFHEVTSKSDPKSKSKAHVAFNYWMHPPATKNYSQPYEDNYWQSLWKEMVELIRDIDAAARSGKRTLAYEEEMSRDEEESEQEEEPEDDVMPAVKRRKE